MLRYWCFLLVLFFSQHLHSQASAEFGAFAGVANYQGDLSPSPFAADQFRLSLGGQFRYLFSPYFAVRPGLTYAMLTGDDRPYTDRYHRGVSMENTVWELSMLAEYHPLGKGHFNSSGFFRRYFSPYVFAGFGYLLSNAEVTWPDDAPRKVAEESSSSLFTVPFGAGLRLALFSRLTTTLEFGLRPTFADNLDGISANGNPGANDWFFITGVSVFYTFVADNDSFDYD